MNKNELVAANLIKNEHIDLTNKKLRNFYGDKLDSRLIKPITKNSIINEAAKKIALIKHEISIHKKSNKKLFKKVRFTEMTNRQSQTKQTKYKKINIISKNKFVIKEYKKKNTLLKFASYFLKHNLKTKINESTKRYKRILAGIKTSWDDVHYKNKATRRAYDYELQIQKTISQDMAIIDQFKKSAISELQFKKTSIGMELERQFLLLKKNAKQALQERNRILSDTNQIQVIEKLKAKKNYQTKINAEKNTQQSSVLELIAQINMIRSQKAASIKKIKLAQKDLNSFLLLLRKYQKKHSPKQLNDLISKLKHRLPSSQLNEEEKVINDLYQSRFANDQFLIEYVDSYIKKISQPKIVFIARWSIALVTFFKLLIINTFLVFSIYLKHIPGLFRSKLKTIYHYHYRYQNFYLKNSWNYEYHHKIALLYNEKYKLQAKYENENLHLLELNQQRFSKIKPSILELRQKYYRQVRKIKKDAKQKQNQHWKEFRSKNISYVAYRNAKKHYRINLKNAKRSLKLNTDFYKIKFDIWEIKRNLANLQRQITRTINNKIEYINKYTPIEVAKGTRWILALGNLLFGGFAALWARQYKKAFIQILITLAIYTFIIPFSFGVYSVGGDGIQGLFKLGSGIVGADSRYYLVEGVYGMVVLFIAAGYIVLLGMSGYRLGLLLELGVRANTWFVTKKVMDRVHLPYLLSIPAFVVVVLTTIAPLLSLFGLAFTDWGKGVEPTKGDIISWVGFNNFKILFGSGVFGQEVSKEFGTILTWTLIWGLSTWALSLVINIFVAIIINSERVKYKGLWRTILILPLAIPGFIMIMMFSILVQDPSSIGANDEGPLWKLLVDMGIWQETRVDEFGIKIVNGFKQNVIAVKTMLILMAIWFGIGGGMLFFTGLMQGISSDLYEAADVDGASAIKKHITITIPQMIFIIAPTLLPGLIGALNNYTMIWLFNSGGPFPIESTVTGAGQTDIIMSWIYKLIQDPTGMQNAIGITAVICILFGAISITISLPGVFKSKIFKEGNW